MTSIAPVNFANRFAHIDALRAIAVLLVVVHHAGWGFVPGPAGVTVFFCISGFVITHICIREQESTDTFRVGRFYLRRLLKLVPPFLVAILIPTLIYAAFSSVNWGTVLAQTFFAYNWVQVWDFPASLAVLPGSEVVWSLAVEEQFYIVFAVLWLLVLQRRNALKWLLAAAVVAIIYATALRLLLVDADAIRIARATDTRMDSIAWGVICAIAFAYIRRGQLKLAWIGSWWVPFAALIAFGGSFVLPGEVARGFAYTLQCAATGLVIMWGLVAQASPVRSAIFWVSEWKPVAVIGLASYSIYLVHHVLIQVMEPLLRSLPGVVVIPVSVTIGVLAGVLLWQWLERPVLKLRPTIESRVLQRV